MGTSKSNSGLRPNKPLLPPWADGVDSPDLLPDDENSNDGEKDQENGDVEPNDGSPVDTGNWSEAKGSLTRLANKGSKSERAKRIPGAAKKYVAGGGGAKKMASSAIHGASVASGFTDLLFSIADKGTKETFKSIGFEDFGEQSIEMVFNRLAEHLSSNGGTVEETIANEAVVEALSQLYEEFDLDNNDITDLDNLTNNQINEILEFYVSTYIYERWLHELGIKIESAKISESQVVQLENEIKLWIESTVSLEFDDYDLANTDLASGEGKKIIENIFQDAYEMIEL